MLAAVTVGLTGCTGQDTEGAQPSSAATSPRVPDVVPVELPEGGLRGLVPAAEQLPDGLVPLLQASGPRDAAAVAAFSADAEAAAAALAANGFADAYVAQYASPTDSRTLTVVVVQFADVDGARADLEGDVAATGGEVVDVTPTIGDASDVRRVALPGDDVNDLVTVRFRAARTTWLLAWRAPLPADPSVPVELARRLAGRA